MTQKTEKTGAWNAIYPTPKKPEHTEIQPQTQGTSKEPTQAGFGLFRGLST